MPRMDAAKLIESYRSVLKRIYGCEAYYERVKTCLNRAMPKSEELVKTALVNRQQCARTG